VEPARERDRPELTAIEHGVAAVAAFALAAAVFFLADADARGAVSSASDLRTQVFPHIGGCAFEGILLAVAAHVASRSSGRRLALGALGFAVLDVVLYFGLQGFALFKEQYASPARGFSFPSTLLVDAGGFAAVDVLGAWLGFWLAARHRGRWHEGLRFELPTAVLVVVIYILQGGRDSVWITGVVVECGAASALLPIFERIVPRGFRALGIHTHAEADA
jgi:hypothetical protein